MFKKTLLLSSATIDNNTFLIDTRTYTQNNDVPRQNVLKRRGASLAMLLLN